MRSIAFVDESALNGRKYIGPIGILQVKPGISIAEISFCKSVTEGLNNLNQIGMSSDQLVQQTIQIVRPFQSPTESNQFRFQHFFKDFSQLAAARGKSYLLTYSQTDDIEV